MKPDLKSHDWWVIAIFWLVLAYLRSCDWWVIASSAGKDSQTQLDYLVELADFLGVPRSRLVVVHADLGRVEWKGTTELAREQADHYGLRFEIVKRGQDLLDHIRKMKFFPKATTRYCTSDHKRDQIQKLIVRLSKETRTAAMERGEKRKDVRVRVLNCVGMRADESARRAKLDPFQRNKRASCGYRAVDVWLPIFDWSTEDVWRRIKASGVRYHGAYDLGMSRLSCAFCVLSCKADLRIAARANPELLDQYVEVEQEIGHRFTLRLSAAELRDEVRADAFEGPDGAALLEESLRAKLHEHKMATLQKLASDLAAPADGGLV